MRSFIAVTLAVGAIADGHDAAAVDTSATAVDTSATAVDTSATAAAVHVAPAARGLARPAYGAISRPGFGAYGAIARPGYGAYGANRFAPNMANPYGAFNGRSAANPMAFGGRPAPYMANPYIARAPMANPYVAAVPVKEAVEAPQYNHEEDYENWRLAYLTSRSENSDSLSYSPMLNNNWNFNDQKNALDREQTSTLRLNFQMDGQRGKLRAAEYALNIAAERNADKADLVDLKKAYEYERLSTMQLMLNDDPVVNYQIARQDYEWDAGDAAEKLKKARTPQERRHAQLLSQEAQMDLLDAVNPLIGGGLNYPSKLGNMVGYMVKSNKARSAQKGFDDATRSYQGSPTAVNFYELQIAELKLEKREAEYMRQLSSLVSPLANLLNGNYGSAMKYKKELTEAKIADLEEKLAAAVYEQRHGKEPFGRTTNMPSNAKTQRAFYNLLGR